MAWITNLSKVIQGKFRELALDSQGIAQDRARHLADKGAEAAGDTHYENDYFSVDAPETWTDEWGVQEKGDASYGFTRGAVGGFTLAAGEQPGPTRTLLGTTSGGKSVYISEAGGSLLGDAGAKVTLKWGLRRSRGAVPRPPRPGHRLPWPPQPAPARPPARPGA